MIFVQHMYNWFPSRGNSFLWKHMVLSNIRGGNGERTWGEIDCKHSKQSLQSDFKGWMAKRGKTGWTWEVASEGRWKITAEHVLRYFPRFESHTREHIQNIYIYIHIYIYTYMVSSGNPFRALPQLPFRTTAVSIPLPPNQIFLLKLAIVHFQIPLLYSPLVQRLICMNPLFHLRPYKRNKILSSLLSPIQSSLSSFFR